MFYDKLQYLLSFSQKLFIVVLITTIGLIEVTSAKQEEFVLIDVDKLDKIFEYSHVDDQGATRTFRKRNLDSVVDNIIQNTNHEDHGHGAAYPLWREALSKPHPTVETLRYYFAQASEEFGVPVAILEAIAQVESNWTQVGPTIDNGWGVMHLVQNNYANTLSEAANLLNIEENILKKYAFQNIRGGAALIAHYAKNSNTLLEIEDWFEAVKKFTGLIDEELRFSQAIRYFEVIKNGNKTGSSTLWGEKIVLNPHPDINIDKFKPDTAQRVLRRNSADYPGAISKIGTTNCLSSRSSRNIDVWVNHWIGLGTLNGALSTFQSSNCGSSAHFIIGKNGDIYQLVAVKDIAWHAGVWSYNDRSIGVEHEVSISHPDGWNTVWTEPLLRASTNLARYFIDQDQYNIPKVHPTGSANGRAGILGHNQIKATQCPGTLPWDKWMSYFNGFDVKLSSNISITPNPIVQGSPVTVKVNIVNLGEQAFVGNIAAALHNQDGSHRGDIQRFDNINIPANTSKEFTFKKPEITSSPNSYPLRINFESPSVGLSWDLIPSGSFQNPIYVDVVDSHANNVGGEIAELTNFSHSTSWAYFYDDIAGQWFIANATGKTYILSGSQGYQGELVWGEVANGENVANVNFSNKTVTLSSSISNNTRQSSYKGISLNNGSANTVYSNRAYNAANSVAGRTLDLSWYFFRVETNLNWYIVSINDPIKIYRMSLKLDKTDYDWQSPKDRSGSVFDTSTLQRSFFYENGEWKVNISQ